VIRSTRHHTKDLNAEKRKIYEKFLDDYSSYTKRVVDSIWNHGYGDFCVKDNKLALSKFLDYKDFDFPTELSARAKSSAVTQAGGIIRASIEKQRRVIWVQENKNALVRNKKFSKPKLNFVQPMLSSKCCDFMEDDDGKFLGFIRLKSIGKAYGSICIPVIKHPRVSGVRQSGFSFAKKSLQVSWDKPASPAPKGDKVLGVDQGIKSVATLSDGQVTPQISPDGYSLESIMEKLSRKRKGSKAFRKAQEHRKNFINWSINQLNFDGVQEVRLEKIVNLRYKRRSSRRMSHWSNPEIRDKIIARCEELEVPVVEQPCAYRSQRCHQCGQVRKSNRKGKQYLCKHCGYSGDADYNASQNHAVDLPCIPVEFLGQKLNLGDGFFWKPSGFTAFDGSELRVPNSQN
jgi:hypothetical protein